MFKNAEGISFDFENYIDKCVSYDEIIEENRDGLDTGTLSSTGIKDLLSEHAKLVLEGKYAESDSMSHMIKGRIEDLTTMSKSQKWMLYIMVFMVRVSSPDNSKSFALAYNIEKDYFYAKSYKGRRSDAIYFIPRKLLQSIVEIEFLN